MSLTSSLLGDLTEGFKLPITRRGKFSQDDFFSRFQQDYSRAVGDVLDRWGSDKSSARANCFASYRKLREDDASDDSQAATISDTPETYVIVLDMNEYASGQITVETVGYSAVVEGQVGQKSYKRRFPLPKNTITDRVKADLSDENILTVTAPRKGKGVAINLDSSDAAAKADSNGTSTSTATAKQDSGIMSSVEAQIIPGEAKSSQQASQTTSSASAFTERMIPTVREGSASTTSSTGSIRSEELSSVSSERRGSKTRVIPLNIEGETTTSSSSTSVRKESTSTKISSGTSVSEAEATSAQSTSDTRERMIPTVRESEDSSKRSTQDQQSTQFTSSSSSTSQQQQSRVLPINRRGRFFQDSTFKGVWDDFESAMDELIAKRGTQSTRVKEQEQEQDRFQSYRNLRQVIQKEDNQAASISKEGDDYKIVMDVKDFVDGHLDVKAVAGAVLVTGKKGSCNFERRYSIPGLSQPEKVAAALSADGVLTITAPK